VASDIFQAIALDDYIALREGASSGEASARNEQGVSAIMYALYSNRRHMVDELRPYAGEIDVFEAAALGDEGRLRALLDEEPELANARYGDGFTPLHFAVFFGTPETTRLLIERGADVEAMATGPIAVRPLGSAAAAGNLEGARALLDAGADVQGTAESGATALHSAALNGDVELARLLLERGAEPDHAKADGATPRSLAAAGGSDELRALLS
jgi:ankyrin repeat protein